MGQTQVFVTRKQVGSGSGSFWQPHIFPVSTPLRWLTNGSDKSWCLCKERTHLWGQRESVAAPIMTDINLRDMYLTPFMSIIWSSSAEGHLCCHRAAYASLCSSVKWQHSYGEQRKCCCSGKRDFRHTSGTLNAQVLFHKILSTS